MPSSAGMSMHLSSSLALHAAGDVSIWLVKQLLCFLLLAILVYSCSVALACCGLGLFRSRGPMLAPHF